MENSNGAITDGIITYNLTMTDAQQVNDVCVDGRLLPKCR